jgi:SAM-dependent MidA family methyltransferase
MSPPTWKQAWAGALYGERGFFRRESPGEHFRTSVHASPLFAGALLALARRAGLEAVVDVGAGRGELLAQLHALDPRMGLLGVEVAPRPTELPDAVGWSPELPAKVDGLVLANEWLDNVPCEVVEVDDTGTRRVVHVDSDGSESLGKALGGSLESWCDRWWPLGPAGTRAEVGLTRDRAWADVVRRVGRGIAIAADYGHTADTRPPFGSLRSYLHGREVDLRLDGSRDVTAGVGVDAVAASVGGVVLSQRDALTSLGVTAARPALDLATSDPAGYLARLSRSGEAAELTAPDGLGGFWWVVWPATALGR